MQQDLKFPARCAPVSAAEQEQITGGAPAWVDEAADMLWPVWYQAEPALRFTGVLINAFVRCVNAAYQVYIAGKIIKNSMAGIKDTMKFFVKL